MSCPFDNTQQAQDMHAVRLLEIIQAHLPGWSVSRIYLRHGRWHATTMQDAEYEISEALENQHFVQPMLWERGNHPRNTLSNSTYRDVQAMCRSLLKANPNNKFVREQYPQIHAELTAHKPTSETTPRGNYNEPQA